MSTVGIEWIDQLHLEVAETAAKKAGAAEDEARRIAHEVVAERLEAKAEEIKAGARYVDRGYAREIGHADELIKRATQLRRMIG